MRLALVGARGAGPGGAIDRQAFDFLTSEVLAQLDDGLREFLLQTSVLHELDAARCEALTGDARAWAHLDALERLDLFVTVVGDDPRTLKLHDLFRDTLRHRLRLERPGEQAALLVRAAANEGDLVRRQGLLLAAGRLDEAAASLRAGSLRLLFEGGVHVVLRLAEQFPPEFARRSADWQDVAGYSKWRLWRNAEAAQHLEAAEALHRERGDAVAARLSALRRAAMLAGIGRPGATRAALVALGPPGPDEIEARIYVHLCQLWIALEEGAGRSVAPRMEELLNALEQAGQPEHWAAMVPSPRLTACPGVGPQLLRWADGVSLAEAESPLLLSALAPMTRGWQALWAGRVREAEHCLRRSASDERWVGHPPIVQSHRLAFTAVVQMALGHHGGRAGGGAGAWARVPGQLRRPRPHVCPEPDGPRGHGLRRRGAAARGAGAGGADPGRGPRGHAAAAAADDRSAGAAWRGSKAAGPKRRRCGSRRWRTRRPATCSVLPTNCAPAWRCRACSAATRPPRPHGCSRCWRMPPTARAAHCSHCPSCASWPVRPGASFWARDEQAVLRAWAADATVPAACLVRDAGRAARLSRS